MDFIRAVLINQTDSVPAILDIKTIAEEIKTIFPRCSIDIRSPFVFKTTALEQAKIVDIKQPFEKQQKPEQYNNVIEIPLYDGFVMQRIFSDIIPSEETDLENVHIIFTNLLPCTFNEDDWRYHGRAVICGTPSIVSTTGIVEALAKPREFYLAQIGSARTENVNLKEKFAGRFIDYDDKQKITAACINFALQAIFFFITDGEPFCNDKECRLYNAHWQEELMHIIEKRRLCVHHENQANKIQ